MMLGEVCKLEPYPIRDVVEKDIMLNKNMRRTIITLDTIDGKYIPVFVVTEKLYPDMQDYDAPLHSKRPKTFEKNKDNLTFTIEEFNETDPFLLNGNCGRMEELGEYIIEPGNGIMMLLPSTGSSVNTLKDVLPKRVCPIEVCCWIDKDRAVWAVLSSEKRLLNQLKFLSESYLGFDLTLYPEHIGNLYSVQYNPYFKKLSFKSSNNPNGLLGKIVYRPGNNCPLHIIVKDKHSGYPVYTVTKELTGTERMFFIETPLYPKQLSIEVQDKDGHMIMMEENVTFLQKIVFDMNVQKFELKLKKQGKKTKNNYEVSIPKYERATKTNIGDMQDDGYTDYFMIADSISRQKADQEALNFMFFDGEANNKEENVKRAKEIIRKMISTGRNVCYICDPYFKADDFVEYVYYIQNLNLDVRIVVCKSPQDNATEYQKRLEALAKITNEYNMKMGRAIVECRSLIKNSYHDRVVYADKTGWLIGSSFSELGHRMTTITKIPKSYSRLILSRIEDWWKDENKSKHVV